MQFIISSGLMFLDYEKDGAIEFKDVTITKKDMKVIDGRLKPQVAQQLFSGYDESLVGLQKCFLILLSVDEAGEWGKQLLKDFTSPKSFVGLVPYKVIVEAANGAKEVNNSFQRDKEACNFLSKLIANSQSSYLYFYMASKFSGYRTFVRDQQGRLTSGFLSLITACKDVFVQLIGLSSLFGFVGFLNYFDNIVKFCSITNAPDIDSIDKDETSSVGGQRLSEANGFKARYAMGLIQKMRPSDDRNRLIGASQQNRHILLKSILKNPVPNCTVDNKPIKTLEELVMYGLTDSKAKTKTFADSKLFKIYDNVDHVKGKINVLATDQLVDRRPKFSAYSNSSDKLEAHESIKHYSMICEELHKMISDENKNFQAAALILFKTNSSKSKCGFNFWRKFIGDGALIPNKNINAEEAKLSSLYSLYLTEEADLSELKSNVLKKGTTYHIRKLTADDDHRVTLTL
ncbi:hypothetical protein AVI53_03015 [Piscirickettsia salmonis]|nr:hypothetical protein PSLF89_2413 [Piscirickettsia salmonis LF-89 = ATCC VR-1361]ALY02918.1 hypothetical protein AWE47_08745 [Piscirickettsia salmonis]AMA42474.1 hypothetical protein AWJ11_08955 [Piscirickettsia salmonis]AOS34944.1 hypothetical protein AVM72_06095 [Piscirickettsia salmonis]APS59653.1 hypothetical protein AVI53_03015 [Piscirickettsia salmonis]